MKGVEVDEKKCYNTFLNSLPILLPCPTAKVFTPLARPTHAHSNFTNLPLVNIFLRMPNALFTTATKNFLFSLEVALLFTFLLLRQFLLNFSIPFYVNKKFSKSRRILFNLFSYWLTSFSQ